MKNFIKIFILLSNYNIIFMRLKVSTTFFKEFLTTASNSQKNQLINLIKQIHEIRNTS